MPQNGQAAVSKCPPIWKKMRKRFKTLSELRLQFIPKASNWEVMAHKWWWYSIATPPPISHSTTLKPLHGLQAITALRPTTYVSLLPVCCHWLPAFKAFLQSQAYDLCHASFLRLFSAILFTAFCISGFRLSVCAT